MNKFKKAFTLIELLVVIAIIAILATLAVVALQNSRASARDAKRLADVKQMQTALELYFNDNNSYPTSITSTIATSGIVYMTTIPTPPTPVDGDCTTENNNYTYSSDGSTYSITFCLGKQTAGLSSGAKVLTRDGILDSGSGGDLGEGSGSFVSCGDIFTDSRDSQQYPTVQIGTQCWMAKNMNYDDSCASNTWENGVDNRWCGCYDNNSSNCATYGKLYQWSAAMAGSTTERAQGICPTGWHVPSSGEFSTLQTYLGGEWPAGDKIKQAGTTTWLSPSTGTNETGFTALPAGNRIDNSGDFSDLNSYSSFWTSASSNPVALIAEMYNTSPALYINVRSQVYGYSVRCIKD